MNEVGFKLGEDEDNFDGSRVGEIDGFFLENGFTLGLFEGVGLNEGLFVGKSVGEIDGFFLEYGFTLGLFEGVGLNEGFFVGFRVGILIDGLKVEG
eukprot:CAMPEP_0170074004 /NCGR_PEP_ID=MMETSP0019_2-20121128/11364_1 /TAXON_ID=98059 /ORGANISM="Dinobryon sp., Strain UTEXLB2267" /LENGTH=95 /DNA_ID=CAMNT_0010283985 /DNA_START=1297 /DNA_END=1584 /DNA_ORIENTATION=-